MALEEQPNSEGCQASYWVSLSVEVDSSDVEDSCRTIPINLSNEFYIAKLGEGRNTNVR